MDGQWYPKLLSDNNSLQSVTTKEDRYSGIILRWEKLETKFNRITGEPQDYMKSTFRLFTDPTKLTIEIFSCQERLKLFHEIIMSDRTQKPRFDLDIELEKVPMLSCTLEELGQKLLQQILSGIQRVCLEIANSFDVERDVIICSSHGKMKQSYHIIVCSFAVKDHIQAGLFKDKVLETVDPDLRILVDDVYKSLQNLRTLGSIKEKRVKIFNEKFTFGDQEITHRYDREFENIKNKFHYQLLKSLVTFTDGLEVFHIGEPKVPVRTGIEIQVDSEIVQACMAALAKRAGFNIGDPMFPYQYRSMKDNMIFLERTIPSNCQICKRAHEKENPYLFLYGKYQSLYFVCRRAAAELGKKKSWIFINHLITPPPNYVTIDITQILDDIERYLLEFEKEFGKPPDPRIRLHSDTTPVKLDPEHVSTVFEPFSDTQREKSLVESVDDIFKPLPSNDIQRKNSLQTLIDF